MAQKGWGEQEEISAEELEKQRTVTLQAYQDKINAIKQQEIELNNKIANAKSIFEDKNKQYENDFKIKANELNDKFINCDAVEVKSREIIASYELKLAAFQSDKEAFESYKSEKNKEIEQTIFHINEQKQMLLDKEFDLESREDANEKESEKHERNINKFNSELADFKIEKNALESLREEIYASENQLKLDQEANALRLKEEADARSEAISKDGLLEGRERAVKAQQEALDEKLLELADQQNSILGQMQQLKLEKSAFDKERDNFKIKQNEVAVQIDKLETLKSQLADTVKEK